MTVEFQMSHADFVTPRWCVCYYAGPEGRFFAKTRIKDYEVLDRRYWPSAARVTKSVLRKIEASRPAMKITKDVG